MPLEPKPLENFLETLGWVNMKRYGTTKIKIDRDGKRVYGTTNYPDIPLDNADKLYTTTKGERIENIAFSFYEDVSLWWIIAKANGIRGRVAFKSAEVIRIPGNVSSIISKFKELNR